MAKRRKRTNSQIPAKGRLRDIADRLWSRAVRDDWACVCAVCGKRKTEAHHLIPRSNYATRYDLRNGVALCTHHHKFDAELSPHLNAAGWLDWFQTYHVSAAEWYWQNSRIRFDGTTNVEFFINTIKRLRQYFDDDEFDSIVGVRFATYLEIN